MSDPIANARKDFDHMVPGTALYFNNGKNKAIRLECPTIALEFTDGLYIGQDPEGFLFYNAFEDFNMKKHDGSAVTHHYSITTTSWNNMTYDIIDFKRDSDTSAYARFIAEDKVGAAAKNQMIGYSKTGSWGKLVIGSTMATVEKSSSNTTITMYNDAIQKKTVWTDGSNLLSHKGFSVNGNLYFRKLSDLSSGTFANYNDDRIVFYKDNWVGTDFTAYFIPLENETGTLKSPDTKTFTGVSWSNV